MKDLKTKPPSQTDAKGTDSANRRRLGRIVHDDRGCASVEWQDAPQNYVRPVLELEHKARSTAKQDAFNPYQRATPQGPTAGGSRRDLRKLSKWIKMMREREERKALDKEKTDEPRED